MPEPTLTSRLAIRDYPKNISPLMEQKWRRLLFLHWECDPHMIQKSLPKGLHVDLFRGKAYVAIVPFFIHDVRPKFGPSLPGFSNLMEMNLRTYVYDETGIPGVWFYSLDINSRLAVQMARTFFYLPYFYADMKSYSTDEQETVYRCQRHEISSISEFIYQGNQNQIKVEPESLEFFLIERYVLFSDKGDHQLVAGRVHHAPYPLYSAKLSKWDDLVFEWDGLVRPGRPPEHICFSSGVDVEIFPLREV